MGDMSSSVSNSGDPCGSFGPDQKRAVVWFFAMIIGGTCLVYKLSAIDLWMYTTGGDLINNKDYRENRLAATSIGSERIDPREANSMITYDTPSSGVPNSGPEGE